MRDAWNIVLISSIRAACIVGLFVSLLFPGTFLSPANSVAGTSLPLSNSAQPAPAAQANARNREGFRPAFQAGERDIHGNQLGGTELINLVAFQEKLYAGTGYWEDPDSRSWSSTLLGVDGARSVRFQRNCRTVFTALED